MPSLLQDELSLAYFVEELTLLDIHIPLDQSQQFNSQDDQGHFYQNADPA